MELIMPKHSFEMSMDEMSYVDGSWKFYTNWWGICVKLTKKECSKLAAGAGAVAIVGRSNPTALAMVTAFGWAASWGAANNGLYLNKAWTGAGWVSW